MKDVNRVSTAFLVSLWQLQANIHIKTMAQNAAYFFFKGCQTATAGSNCEVQNYLPHQQLLITQTLSRAFDETAAGTGKREVTREEEFEVGLSSSYVSTHVRI